VIRTSGQCATLDGMTNLAALSNEFADAVAHAAPSVVQVLGGRRPASGVAHGPDTIVTTARAIGREDGLRVRPGGADLDPVEADLAGWDPATGIAVLRTRSPLALTAPSIAAAEPRPGEIVLALARSWSSAVTATAGIVAVVGGPLWTGRRRRIERVFRITAPLHDGFAGGGIFDASGNLAGIATASAIRGLAVGIPAAIAWSAAAHVLTAGTPRRGFIGVAVQAVQLPAAQRVDDRERALLVMGITPSSPAEAAGLLVGDLLLDVDGQPCGSPEDLLELLTVRQVGQDLTARVIRGGAEHEIRIRIAERPREPNDR
jgi:S1-C subfamily serine protease